MCGGGRGDVVLVLLHQGHFDSLDLGYMGGLLDDAAGGAGHAVLLPLRQVGQGHGGVDLPPVGLVSALHLLPMGRSPPDASAASATADAADAADAAQGCGRQNKLQESSDLIWAAKERAKRKDRGLTCHIYLIHDLRVLKVQRAGKKKKKYESFVSFLEGGSVQVQNTCCSAFALLVVGLGRGAEGLVRNREENKVSRAQLMWMTHKLHSLKRLPAADKRAPRRPASLIYRAESERM